MKSFGFYRGFKVLFSAFCLLSTLSLQAQTEEFVIYEQQVLKHVAVHPETRSIGTSLLFVIPEVTEQPKLDYSYFTNLGINVFVTTQPDLLPKSIQFIKERDSHFRLDPNKIGIVGFGGSSGFLSNANTGAFCASILQKSEQLDLNNLPEELPLYVLSESKDRETVKAILKSYTKAVAAGKKVSLELLDTTDFPDNATAFRDKIQQSLYSYIDMLYGHEPLYSEKTEAQKQAENWKNFQKMIEDRVKNDWAWLNRYAGDNDKLQEETDDPDRVVFLGNSITEGWGMQVPEYFKQNNYINRGIGGQTTPQMLVRFREDVIDLKPARVIILAGINDIAQNTGPMEVETIFGNIVSMAQLALINNIEPVLCSVLPAKGFLWNPDIDPIEKIKELNRLLKNYAQQEDLIYVDYYSQMLDEEQGLQKLYTEDGVHPNIKGYEVMKHILENTIN